MLHKYRTLYSMTGVVVAILFIMIFSGFSLFYYSKTKALAWNTTSENISNYIEESANFLTIQINDSLSQTEKVAQTISESDISTPNKLQEMLNFLQQNGSFSDIGIAFTDGILHTASGENIDISQYKSFLNAKLGQSSTSLTTLDSSKQKYFSFSCPIQKDGEFIGMVSCFKSQKLLFYHLDEQFTLVGLDGRFLLDDEAYGLFWQINNFKYRDQVETLDQGFSNGNHGTVRLIYNGELSLIGYYPLEINEDWFLVSIVPETLVMAQFHDLEVLSNSAILFLFVLLLATFILLSLFIRCANQRVDNLAFKDPVTGIGNRNYFIANGGRLIQKNKEIPYAIVHSDINRFNYINNMFGYQQGDQVLQQIAKILSKSVSSDELVARSTNDNFLLLLKFETEDLLQERLNQLCERICQDVAPIINNYRLTFTNGIYIIQDYSQEITVSIDKANFARKSIKGQHHTTNVFYDQSTDDHAVNQRVIETSMEDALLNEEFIPVIQPKFDFNTIKLAGAEALARWNSPTLGPMQPYQFIPIFEQNGFITKLDMYMFEFVCRSIQKWLENGYPIVPVSVNFSRVHIYNPNFTAELKQIFDKYHIPAHYIELEITESAMIENIDILMDIMEQCHRIGFALSIDDFGTGYSSLSLLKDLPVDVIKVDKSFLSGENVESASLVIAKVVEIAKSLHIQVVVEGVETQEQADFLRSIGCDLAQGFLYAKPMPVDAFEKLLASQDSFQCANPLTSD